MTKNIFNLLENAKSLEERQEIIQNSLKKKIPEIEKINGVSVLDIDRYNGLNAGDRVKYVNVWNKNAVGYVYYFFKRGEGKPTPLMINQDGFGYSTHHGFGKPEKA